MLTQLRAFLTYANVMATVAVFVALGGTSYALATGSIDSRELKNNNVRSKDLRNNDVRTQDIRNGTVRGRDVGGNTLTGADINEGLLGQVPTAASAGRAASAGSANRATLAGTVRQTFRDDSVAAPATNPGQNWTLLSTTVPAGSYVLTGKATVDNNETTGPVEIRCFMRVGSKILDRANLGLGIQPGDEDIGPFTVTSVHNSATPFTVVLECTNQGNAAGDTAAQDRKIVAYPVADVVSTQAAGP